MNILLGGDFHSGADTGITPPGYEQGPEINNGKNRKRQKLIWKAYQEMVNSLPPIDYFILMGDMVHGADPKDTGRGNVSNNPAVQAEMAIKAIRIVRARKHLLVYGTDYHVTIDGLDVEDLIADALEIPKETPWRGDHTFPLIEGIQFDLKHRIGCSSLPASRPRILAQEVEHAKQWVLEGVQPMPQILARAHCHYYAEARGTTKQGEWLAINVPSLQGLGSTYGARVCVGVVHFGLVLLTMDKEGHITCTPLLERPQSPNIRL